jgi:hypothetical protein
LRQSRSRYAIRAGRNLPDKELRYLRTVIVTAAVYRGFSSELLPEGITRPFNLPAPSTRQSVYVDLVVLAQTCVFSKQSLRLFLCDPLWLMMKINHQTGHSLSRSYGVNLPSSLTRVLSSALGSSPHLPVSVLVRSPSSLLRGFSRRPIRSLRPKEDSIQLLSLLLRICLQRPSSQKRPRSPGR